jgi:hypothetical protein
MNNSRAVSPSPAFNRVAFPETATLTHSGGTAPVWHRTSLLCPYWAPEVYKYDEPKGGLQAAVAVAGVLSRSGSQHDSTTVG